ncbi:MAG: hypothetical protein F4227_06710 [Gammaproteobacteria bacterium]|nr:hypothetical protein [Gammaproteobacteria bacterium]MYF02651.1 hypothetical protein [Gammaproteobacteria bacterium]
MSRKLLLLTIGIYVSLTSNLGIANASDDIEFSGTIAFEPRWFWDDSLFGSDTREKGISNSFYVMPELDAKLSENTSFRLVGFFRYDETDRDRTRGDVREAYLVHYRPTQLGELEMRIGLGRVFWGATESHHLIDIVNQTDLVENPNEEFKLGQPMIHLTLSTESGIFELFGLPFHRQRTFPGPNGRLGFPFLIDIDSVVYDNVYDERHFDLAFRYSHTFGYLDAGISGFVGTNREPSFVPNFASDLPLTFSPFYTQISQTSIDLRLQHSGWLLKFEGLRRTGALNRLGKNEDYTAFVAGFEYSIFSLFGTVADMTLVAEWSFDDRRERATTRFDNDLFVASRVSFNDFQGTTITASALLGNDNDSAIASLEFSRRVSERVSVAMELVLLNEIATDDVLFPLKNDSYLEVGLTYGF